VEKKELLEALDTYKADIVKINDELKTANAEEVKKLEASLKSAQDARDVMQKQLDEISTNVKNFEKFQKEAREKASKNIYDAAIELFNSKDFQEAKKNNFVTKSRFDLKVDTTSITGNVNRTRQNLTVSYAPENQLAFIPNFGGGGTIDQDKNRVLWVDGAYTSNVGYVTEGTGQATADTGTATEKAREMAKISAKLPLTAEMMEDANYFASSLRSKMQEKSLLFTDGEAYDGDGSDAGETKHIYGIKDHATAFSAATAGVSASVEKANIGDLVDAMILQAEKSNFRGSNILWMNPTDFYTFKTTKDADGQYLFVPDVNGEYSIRGLRVVRSNRVTAGDMLLADTSKLQYWTKRQPEIKFSQMNASDFVNDSWTAVFFVRSQVVVETADKLSLIFVDDITAAIASLNKSGA
jgi:HK97 family phage major capsid protein